MAIVDKKQVLELCRLKAQEHLQDLRSAMQKVRESIEGEEKSSAGDKYETARAMAQNEMERLSIQLEKAKLEYNTLQSIDARDHSEQVHIGSLVETKNKLLFIAVALGKLMVNGQSVFVVSPSSPIGQEVLKKSVGHTFKIGPNTDTIVRIN